MKWFVILGIAVCLLFAGLAWAEVEIPETLTPEEEAELQRILGMGPDDSTNCVGVDIPGATCIYPKGAWAVISKPFFFSCNLDPKVDVKVHASVAQWITISLSATEINWYVLKPGCYDVWWMWGCLTSNGDVDLKFEGFEDLKSTTDPTKTIPTYYMFWPGDLTWVRAINFNGVKNIPEPKLGFNFRILNKIEVSNLTSACEYEDCAKIIATLKEQKTWVIPCPS